MDSVTAFGNLRRAWRAWGECSFIVVGVLWLVFQLLATLDAHESVCRFLSEYDHLELDEVLLLAALALPVACAVLWYQSRRLKQEIFRRTTSDALTNILLNVREQERNLPRGEGRRL